MGQSQLTPFFLQTLFIYLLLLLTLASGQQQWDGVAITGTNYQALQAFKRALEDPKGFLKSWNNDTAVGGGACSGDWLGIRCVQGQVTVIQLPWKGLGGRISDRIDQLKALTRLSLHDNSIGGQIPSALGSLPRLRGLYLFSNRFTGAIPPSIGNCLLLRTLDLSNNSLTGLIPDALSNSTRLYRLNLSYNRLAGRIPAGLTRSPSLNFLSLQHNNLHGSIPDTWGGAGAVFNFIEVLSSNPAYQLQALNLDHNSLTGNLPTSLSRLQMLQEITISCNQIDGSIPEELARLSMLQTLDISNNAIRGSFPASLCNLSSLAKLNLESNFLGNHIPEAIDGLKNLSFLSLRRNQFQGRIPATLGSISSLKQLDLSENNFFGEIPASFVHLNELVTFNVSDNNLSGPVPLPLSERFNSTSFFGNIQLCGYSISVPCSPPPSPSPSLPPPSVLPLKHHDDRKLTTKDIILIAAGAVLAFFLLLFCCLLLCCLIRKRTSLSKKGAVAAGTDRRGHRNQGPEMESSGGDAGGKLVHFDGPLAFTADDLLCATAEVIGKSGYGTVYRATLEDGNQVAVKRLREKIAKNHREFEAEVNELGKIRHPNLLALRAYYMGPKGEKLLVSDIMPKGSLAAFLHARGPDTPIDWPTRMNIAMGMARGLHYLHSQQKMVHGDLASSNILLDENTNAKIADFGLSRLMTSPANANVALGYCAPELSKLKKANTKTDVYSLGVIILELLTGKSPGEAMNSPDLPQWVASIVKEEWTNEVFDLELMKDAAGNSTGDELLNTLKLALHCVDPLPDARPDAQQVLQQLEEIKPDLAAGAEVSTEEGDRAYDQ